MSSVVLPHQPLQGVHDELSLSTSSAGRRLVEQQDWRAANHGSGDGDALPLATRKRHSARADDCSIPVLQALDELVNTGRVDGFCDFVRAGIRPPVQDVFENRGLKQHRVLQDEGGLLAERIETEVSDVFAIDQGSGPPSGLYSLGMRLRMVLLPAPL